MELIATRGYFFCRYCGSFHFPETAGTDGIRILGDSQSPQTCVACSKPLTPAVLDETHPVQYCRNCRGVLIARRGFAAVVEKRRAWATQPPGPPVRLNRSELNRKVMCPSCKKPMATHPYYGPGNVIIDTCEKCEVVWLDFGELKQIVDAPGKDRGSREQVPQSMIDTSDGSLTGARLVGSGIGSDEESDGDVLDLVARLFSR
jgi:Zn-finger nucleic acid-binding protein